MSGIREQIGQETRARKADKLHHLRNEHAASLNELVDNIEAVKQEGEKVASTTRQHYIKTLRDLIERKTKIERNLLSNVGVLFEEYTDMEAILKMVYQARMEEYEESIKQLTGDEEGDAGGEDAKVVGNSGGGGGSDVKERKQRKVRIVVRSDIDEERMEE